MKGILSLNILEYQNISAPQFISLERVNLKNCKLLSGDCLTFGLSFIGALLDALRVFCRDIKDITNL